MATGARDCFFILGRRQWEDGMALEGSATFWRHDCDDGGMVLEVEDEAGSGAFYVLPPEMAAPMRAMHEAIFVGLVVTELAVR